MTKARTGFLVICGFIVISVACAAWMTGFMFAFREAKVFPNYNMLAAEFAEGQFFIGVWLSRPSARVSLFSVRHASQFTTKFAGSIAW